MKPFLDANILVAILNRELPVFSDCARLLSLAEKPGLTLSTSPLCLAIAWYFASKKCGDARAAEKIRILADKLEITAVDGETTLAALADKRVGDLEDGLEYYAAVRAGCSHIISLDTNDFYFSRIPVCEPGAFLREFVGGKRSFH